MEALKDWWMEASPKDQLALIILTVCIFIYALFNLVLFPTAEMADEQQRRVTAQKQAFDRVRNLTAELNAVQNPSDFSAAEKTVEQIVQSSFSQHGLRVSGFDASGRSGVRVRFESVSYEKLLVWFHDLELSQGLRFKDISVASSSDAGLVSASVLIQKN